MLEIDHISVSFPGFSLEDVSLSVDEGDYLVLLGVSGAGKTVLLEVLAGLVKPSSGKVLLKGADITDHRIQHRGIGLVYQDLSLFPHLTVGQNIAYPMRSKKIHPVEVKKRLALLAQQTGITHLIDRYPSTLSGGEAQRTALARTLAAEPGVLLLDEPLASLDVKLKADLRGLLRKIHQTGKTIIHVTHDYMEAATLANKVAVIERGRLVQTGTPDAVFRHPATEFVARFSGIKNLFACTVEHEVGDSGLNKAVISTELSLMFVGQASEKAGFVMVPQEDILLSQTRLDSSALNQVSGLIKEVYHSGQGMEVVVGAGPDFVVSVSRSSYDRMDLVPGKRIWLNFKASAVKFIAG
ncbi:MAG: ATP-binding cassette domain-containing protein [Bacteroidales bacterium]